MSSTIGPGKWVNVLERFGMHSNIYLQSKPTRGSRLDPLDSAPPETVFTYTGAVIVCRLYPGGALQLTIEGGQTETGSYESLVELLNK